MDGVSGRSFTYKSAFQESRSFGSALSKVGMIKGDVLGSLLPNCPQYLMSLLGAIGNNHEYQLRTGVPNHYSNSKRVCGVDPSKGCTCVIRVPYLLYLVYNQIQ